MKRFFILLLALGSSLSLPSVALAKEGAEKPNVIVILSDDLGWGSVGCYGANLATWLMDGQRPLSVQATTQRIKPDVYPKVEDEATIVVTYPKAQAIFQASWNWPYNRKDMEIYGQTGYVLVPNANLLRVRPTEQPQGDLPSARRHPARRRLAAGHRLSGIVFCAG